MRTVFSIPEIPFVDICTTFEVISERFIQISISLSIVCQQKKVGLEKIEKVQNVNFLAIYLIL